MRELENKPKNSQPLPPTRGERELLKWVRVRGEIGIRSIDLERMPLDSVKSVSVRVLLLRLVRKGLLRILREEKHYGSGRPMHVYVETEDGKKVNL